jgi:uncharacterized protein
MNILSDLDSRGLIHPPKWLINNTQYLVVTGSQAYGIETPESDFDIYGFSIPPKEDVFPHLKGVIDGFGKQIQKFEQWSEQHITHPDIKNGRQHDLSVYGIVKFFQLVMENNPNMIETLFVPTNCVLHSSQIGNLVRENRKEFLHKGCWHKLKGYAFSQMHKMENKNPVGKRIELVEKYGYDTKFASHVVRLLGEAEMVLMEGDIDLQRNREQLKAIRRGEWTEQQIKEYFSSKEKQLEELYLKSTLRHSPDEPKIKDLLLECLTIHYGNLDKTIVRQDIATSALKKIEGILEDVRRQTEIQNIRSIKTDG